MTPKSFDVDTAKQIAGDSRMREIETKARADAELNKYDPPPSNEGSYWSQVVGEMDSVVYFAAYKKRRERMERKNNQPTEVL
jgi:hypothetical protein